MRYHLFLNFFRKVGKIAKVFSRKLAVPRYMSTSVVHKQYLHYTPFKMGKVMDFNTCGYGDSLGGFELMGITPK